MDSQKIVIGITQGDPSGVGIELLLQVFADTNMYKYCIPVLYGNPNSLNAWKKHLDMQTPLFHLVESAAQAIQGKLNLVVSSEDEIHCEIGKASAEAGLQALKAIDKALADIEHLSALVTAPIDKSTIAPHTPNFTGHTSYLADFLGASSHAMMLVCESLRVALVTEHVPITQLGKFLTQSKIEQKIDVVYNALRTDFNVIKPRIAVLGLNPHAGDHGLLGQEEETIIKPAIATHFKKGRLVYGPYSADGFFGSGNYKHFDAVIAMYHDQGLIPFKTMSFMDGVNVTLGLSIVRSSPDHGTAYEIAGKGTADASSMRAAVYEAIHLVRNRKQFSEDSANPLSFAELRRERFRIDF
ncbi:MAG: 4-hydroxythreonine-4-phosphate dehydrogenase PdxA [Flavobacteriales bacterium]|nr:4-hydroxythreonine-4-phosphate dehydrogenase PdxA [Flavobacteriaceae bacterium]PHX91743.1 MAG: 4-hydroxythreonine-4-phosphate dehydrogenase PdxA [Flavobacteriales bacterium]